MTRIADTRRWIASHAEPLFNTVAWACAGFILWVALTALTGCRMFGGGGGAADGGTFPAADSGNTDSELGVAGGAERGAAGVPIGGGGTGGDSGGVPPNVDSDGGAVADGDSDSGGSGVVGGEEGLVPDPGGGSGGGLGDTPPGSVVAQATIGNVVCGIIGFACGAVAFIVLDFIADKRAGRRRVKQCVTPQEVKAR